MPQKSDLNGDSWRFFSEYATTEILTEPERLNESAIHKGFFLRSRVAGIQSRVASIRSRVARI